MIEYGSREYLLTIKQGRFSLKRWRELCKRLGARDNPATNATIDGMYCVLAIAYREPNRHYHNLEHIDEGLVLIDELRPTIEEPDALEMAWWHHDLVYRVNSPVTKYNELNSAIRVFVSLSELNVHSSICTRSMELVMPTLHSYIPSGLDERLIVDIDLVRLGAPPDEFDRHSDNIRKEYGATTGEFCLGRAKFFRQFLKNRPSVYLTDYFRNKYEAQAQENIRRELTKAGL